MAVRRTTARYYSHWLLPSPHHAALTLTAAVVVSGVTQTVGITYYAQQTFKVGTLAATRWVKHDEIFRIKFVHLIPQLI